MRFWAPCAIWAAFALIATLTRPSSAALGTPDVHLEDGDEEPPSSAETSNGSPKHHRRPARPVLSVSDSVIPIPLGDSSGVQPLWRPPGPKQMRLSTLLTELGGPLDPNRMSIDMPSSLVEEEDISSSLNGSHHEELPVEAEAWLLRKAACRVRYEWENVSESFWPRWIKKGKCVNDPKRSCSWPPGMHCVPAETLFLRVLRWHCRARSRRSTRAPHSVKHKKNVRCQWLNVPYPVTDKCMCTC